ncbi:MAG: hypothetical protein V3U02_04600 [Calditrichia bacterium]
MTVCFHLQRTVYTSRKAALGLRRKDSKIMRCKNEKCRILFETKKQYPQTTCIFCRIEASGENYRNKMDKFDPVKYLAKSKQLEIEKDNVMKAKGVTVRNQVKPVRITIN